MTDVKKLGDFSPAPSRFPRLEEVLTSFHTPDFLQLQENERAEKIHRLLLKLIDESSTPCFLLAAVNEFFTKISEKNLLSSYMMSHFELWLNQFSGLSPERNYEVRAKIMGKHIPREAYQMQFPVGMGKVYPGSHFVTAHSSPDLDTTVASFWGWVDAFAARVGEGLHIWNVPGGPPESQAEIQFLFYDLLGPGCFNHFAKTRSALSLSAIDLMTQKGMVKLTPEESAQTFDYDKSQQAVVLIDNQGYYLGDWRQLDVEGVRKVTTLLNNSMRWFAGYFQRKLTSLFSKETLSQKEVSLFVEEILSLRLKDAEPAKEFTEKQKKRIESYLSKILKVPGGWGETYGQFCIAVDKIGLSEFAAFRRILSALPTSDLFDTKGNLIENRPKIFHYIEKIVTSLENAIQTLRSYVDSLGVALEIKKEVFGYPPQVISHRTEVEEIRSKMGPLSHLTVTMPNSDGKLSPLGIIQSLDIAKPTLGTVSLRDFCNRDEMKIPSYFEIISVVDHHKSLLTTLFAPSAMISDAQSSNSLVAELAFAVNDKYGLSGRSEKDIQQQIDRTDLASSANQRILQKLLRKKWIAVENKPYFVDWRREYLEYLQCLYAILDDTDLLSKVSLRDVLCVESLLNRLKSLQLGSEAETISLDDIPLDEKFTSKAAKKILRNEDMHSLYKKIYDHKELSFEQNLRFCVKGEPSNVFADTKVQNECTRVGQTKLFAKNFPYYLKHAHEIRSLWYTEAEHFYEERQECDLHMHMISTIPGSEDVYTEKEILHEHQDELWIWIPMQEQAVGHLKSFLNGFRFSAAAVNNTIEVEFLGRDAKALEQIFDESFPTAVKKAPSIKTSVPIAVLRYRAGLLNSRKAMISPYLPKTIS